MVTYTVAPSDAFGNVETSHSAKAIQVVLHLSSEECRTQTPGALDLLELRHRAAARRERRGQSICRALEKLSRGTLGISLWRHTTTYSQDWACACEAGNIVGDEQQCCLVTPKNPPPLGVGSLNRNHIPCKPHVARCVHAMPAGNCQVPLIP